MTESQVQKETSHLQTPFRALVPPVATLRHRVAPTVTATSCHTVQTQHYGSAVGQIQMICFGIGLAEDGIIRQALQQRQGLWTYKEGAKVSESCQFKTLLDTPKTALNTE